MNTRSEENDNQTKDKISQTLKRIEIAINELTPHLINRDHTKERLRDEMSQCQTTISQLVEFKQCTLDGIQQYDSYK